MKYLIIFFLLGSFIFSCKKSTERTCFKSNGELVQREIILDSVSEFKLYKNINYHMYQDSLQKLIIRGGENLVDLIDVKNESTVVSISNKNKCNFLRDFENKITVEIHYPFYKKIYSETQDSLVFIDKIFSDYLEINQALGGGIVQLDVAVTIFKIYVSGGVGSFILEGDANYAELSLQGLASGDATKFSAPSFLIDNNSTGDMNVNLDSAAATVKVRGTGNVIYTGNADTIIISKTGDGEVIQE